MASFQQHARETGGGQPRNQQVRELQSEPHALNGTVCWPRTSFYDDFVLTVILLCHLQDQ